MRLIKKPEVPKVILLQRRFQEDNLKKANTVFQEVFNVQKHNFFFKYLLLKKNRDGRTKFFMCVSGFEKLRMLWVLFCYSALSYLYDCVISA